MIDWRGLFDAVRVPWRDKGRNTSKNNVNVNCPWCRDDDGFHLGVSIEKPVFYCFRRPEHSGSNLRGLLIKLGQSRVEAIKLLDQFEGALDAPRAIPVLSPPGKTEAAWGRFQQPTTAVLDYIWNRGFEQPDEVALRYDIRAADHGKWAWRMLLPLRLDGQVASWTGRAIRASMIPKYLNRETGLEGLIYLPRPARDLMVVCEGPLDALKLAVAGEQLPIAALALTGKQMNEARAWNVRRACQGARRVRLCLDTNVAIGETSRMLAELRGCLPACDVRYTKLPAGEADAGGMTEVNAERWLNDLLAR